MDKIVKEALDLQEAMNNLAIVASIDIEHPPRIGVVRGLLLVTDEEEFSLGSIQWLSGEGYEIIGKILEATYKTIYDHLLTLYENGEIDWDNQKIVKGVTSMMDLAGESAHKIDRYLSFWLDKPILIKIAQGTEFKHLSQFYTQKFLPKIKGLEEPLLHEDLADVYGDGLKNFEMVLNDKEYELFYIRNEMGRPYFSQELLRKVKLAVDFDSEGESFEEDPLLKIRSMRDRDLHASAAQILNDCHLSIQDLFKMSRKLVNNSLAQQLNMAIMALFLAANPRYLIQNTTGKSCLQYFDDFHHFLRAALKTDEYQKWIAYPPEASDRLASSLLYLTHSLCLSLFYRKGGIKQEAIGLVYRTMRRGFEEEKKKLLKGDALWNQFLLQDENLRALLARFPNGPLFKILDLIREEESEDLNIPFDPIGQGNLPLHLYKIEREGKWIDVLRLPSPTKQSSIGKVEILEEFRGFLRALSQDQKRRAHLIINLQDRTSWRECARSLTLENLQKNAEFHLKLFVLTLPKDTDFYYQNNEYLNLNRTDEFIEAFKQQLKKPEECGYYFPSSFKHSELVSFTEQVLPFIATCFFHGKNTLTSRNREDFIEIFYQFLILKAIDSLEPCSISFTCKDAVDAGSAQSATFYAFLQLLNQDFAAKENHDFFLWLLYMPALFIRERAIDPEKLHRTLSCLERIDSAFSEDPKEVLKNPLLKEKVPRII